MALSRDDIPSMNIAFVSDYSYPYTKGGVETRYYTLARYLISRGHRVTWFTSQQWKGPKEQKIEGIRLVGICPAYCAYNRKGKRSKTQALLFGLATLKLLIRPNQFDVIDFSQYPFFHSFSIKIYSILRRVPIVVSWYEFWGDHWLDYQGQIGGRVGRLIEKFTARIIDQKIVISEQTLKRLTGVRCNSNSLYYVPNWIDHKNIMAVTPIGTPYDVCYFGRLKDHKNVNLLLRAIGLCRNEGLFLRTKILGDGPERQNLEKLTQELRLDSQVKFLGRIEEHNNLLGYVKSAQLFVNPSTKEGGGSIVCLEANACGVPILAVRHPLGLDKSLIVEGQTGYWVKEATSRALADKLHQYFQKSVTQREKMSQMAVEWSSQYDIKCLCSRVEMIYAELAAKKRR